VLALAAVAGLGLALGPGGSAGAHGLEHVVGDLEGLVDVVLGVCAGDVVALEAQRQHEVPGVGHAAVERDVGVVVVAQQVAVAAQGTVEEVEDEDAAEPGHGRRDRELRHDLAQPGAHPLAEPVGALVEVGMVAQVGQGGDGGGGTGRVAVVGAGQQDVAAGRGVEPLHQGGRAGQPGDREAVAHRLAEGGEVWPDAAHLLVAAERVPEAGDDLVEDEQRALLAGQRAQPRHERLARHQRADVVRDRFEDDRGDPLGTGVEQRAD